MSVKSWLTETRYSWNLQARVDFADGPPVPAVPSTPPVDALSDVTGRLRVSCPARRFRKPSCTQVAAAPPSLSLERFDSVFEPERCTRFDPGIWWVEWQPCQYHDARRSTANGPGGSGFTLNGPSPQTTSDSIMPELPHHARPFTIRHRPRTAFAPARPPFGTTPRTELIMHHGDPTGADRDREWTSAGCRRRAC